MDDAPPAHRSRFPRWVYGVGSEPDARFSLANERTFLAWVRTALALLASGVALEALDLPIQENLRFAAALVLVVVGLVAPVLAWLGWARAERAVRLQRPLPAPSSFGLLVVGVVLAGALVLVGMVLA
jgi:putative membrane protein